MPRSTGTSSSFSGAPPPLPGQSGYGVTPTQKLEQEARAMERRLEQLKLTMAANKSTREKEGRGGNRGGSRWRSGNSKRGSLRKYDKDVRALQAQKRSRAAQQRRKKESVSQNHDHDHTHNRNAHHSNSNFSLSGSLNQNQNNNQNNTSVGNTRFGGTTLKDKRNQNQHSKTKTKTKTKTNLKFALPSQQKEVQAAVRQRLGTAPVDAWSTTDVQQWLSHILGLPLYAPVFEQNQISGDVLLELGVDDLDYMKITVLAHRKKLLKAVEALRRGKGVGSNDPPAMSTDALSHGHGESVDMGSQAQAQKSVHWSQAKPLSDNVVTGGEVPVNLADGTYDERANQLAFQRAVSDWRNGTVTVADQEHANDQDDGMWTAPWAAIESKENEKEKSGHVVIMRESESESGKSASAGHGTHHGHGILAEGPMVDEEAERLAFQRAVEEWRNPGAFAGTAKNANHTGTGTGNSPHGGKSKEEQLDALSKTLDSGFAASMTRTKRERMQLIERMADEKHRMAAEMDAIRRRKEQLQKEQREYDEGKRNENESEEDGLYGNEDIYDGNADGNGDNGENEDHMNSRPYSRSALVKEDYSNIWDIGGNDDFY